MTTAAGVDLGRVREELGALGATVSDEDPIPLGEHEQVVRAEGPRDLPERARDADSVKEVSPDSELELY